jgi:hypothetical protein
MTVYELIEALQEIPFDSEVTVEVSSNGTGLMFTDSEGEESFLDFAKEEEDE